MKKDLHTSLIGAFIVGAVALAAIGIAAIGSGQLFRQSDRFVLHFSGSVKGLDVGAPVKLKGVTIGKVVQINLEYSPLNTVFYTQVFIDVPRDAVRLIGTAQRTPSESPFFAPTVSMDTMIEAGLRAKLELQGFVTGKLLVAFDFYPESPVLLMGFNENYQELPTLPSEMEALAKTFDSIDFRAIAESVSNVAAGIDSLINSSDLHAAAASMNDALMRYGQLASALEDRTDQLTADMATTLADIRRLIQNTDRQVAPMTQEVTDTAADIRKRVANLEARLIPMTTSIEATVESAESAFQQAEATLSNLNRLSNGDSAFIYQIEETLVEMRAAARSLSVLTEYLSRHPEALVHGKRAGGKE